MVRFAWIAAVAVVAGVPTHADGIPADHAPSLLEPESLEDQDNECTVAEGSDCALNALQRGAKMAQKDLDQASSEKGLWCSGAAAPRLWSPVAGTATTKIKVLSYNLFWWSLFKVRHGNNNSAGKLILANSEVPFDVMGFQECDDARWVLAPVGLSKQFNMIQGPHGTCMAYNKDSWKFLSKGSGEVGEDIPMRYYGKRGTHFMRLAHLKTGTKLFFINHHGPLSINSGGICGGEATAHNLLHVMAKHAEPGDAIVLVGDFNSNAASLTIQTLWQRLVHVFVGPSFGGVDNIFSNVNRASIIETKVLGSGGSDHAAISATLQVGGPPQDSNTFDASAVAVNELTGIAKPGHDWQYFWCGLMEMNVGYVMATDAWTKESNARDPDRCCRACQDDPHCAAWRWQNGQPCLLSGVNPTGKKAMNGVVSGLAYRAAAKAAQKAANLAISEM